MTRVVPLRRPWLWLGSALVVVLAALLAVSIYRNPNIQHSVILQYQFAPAIPVLRLASGFYTWLLRGTPLLVQILIWGNLALLFEYLGPFLTNDVLTPFVASVIALGLNEGAYMAEIVRAGIIAVDRGQNDAALALGMSHPLALRRIILPQALRVIMPPAGNQFISLLKATSLVSVIAGGDMLTAAQNISSANLHTIELMLVATFWYLVLPTIASLGQHYPEPRLGRSGVELHAPS